MNELLLELLSEEIPAFMQKNAQSAYYDIFSKLFNKYNISFKDIKVFITPRRIVLHVADLSFISHSIEIKGPKINAPEEAIEGFCKSNKINRDHLSEISIKGQLYCAYIKDAPETSLADLLSKILPIGIGEYNWPKTMCWGDYDLRWIRPLKNILCIFNNNLLEIKFGHLTANNNTYGHKIITSNESIRVLDYEDYIKKLKNAYVIIDPLERQHIIKQQLLDAATKLGGDVNIDESLLEEVIGLVEYPQVMVGNIPKKFLSLPNEVLITAVRIHQKYFTIVNQEGNFLPNFLFVANMPSSELIVKGNEKVLVARLEDALYFYNYDMSRNLNVAIKSLKNVIFYASLGNLKDKTERLMKIAQYIAPNIHDLITAAQLCKIDLTSQLVGEFPELQGIAGHYYALHSGYNRDISIAIRDHYKPQGQADHLPKGNITDGSISSVGIAPLLAIIDKVDTLSGFALIKEMPSASKDPYGLRRSAIGLIRIILTYEINCDLKEIFSFAAGLYMKNFNQDYNNCIYDIIAFIEERFKFYLKKQYDISLINATIDLQNNSNILWCIRKLSALDKFISTNNGQIVLGIYKRVNNIIKHIDIKNNNTNTSYFTSKYEHELCNKIIYLQNQMITISDFSKRLNNLTEITEAVNNFFDNVMVNVSDSNVTNNRKLLLYQVRELFAQVVNFDYL